MIETGRKVSLIAELCRVLDSKSRAMECAMSHGQVLVGGHVVKPEHDRHWTREQLAGRTAQLTYRDRPFRTATLFPETRSTRDG